MIAQKKTGFSFLEVMVSLAIMAIVVVGIFKMHAQSISMADTTKFYTTAPMLAYQKLAEFDAFFDGDTIKNERSGQFGKDYSEYRWSIFVEPAKMDMIGDISKDFKKIEITISLRNNEQTYHLRAYRFLRP